MQDKFIEDGGTYKEVKIGQLFDIHPTKSYGVTNYKLFETAGKTPVIVNSSTNNGIGGYVDLKPTEKGNMITYSDTTTADTIFYQPEDFIGYSHIQGLYPYDSEDWNEKTYLYFLVLFRKATFGQFDYANKFNRNAAKELKIMLPINADGKIDYTFMENYISELEEERISELEEERISELEKYLMVSGLDTYQLSKDEKEALDDYQSKKIIYQEYRIKDLFDVHSSKRKFNANTIKFGGKYPYVARGSSNNGIRGYITQDTKYLNAAKTISFGQDTATIFYQEKPYFTGDKIKVMTYKKGQLTPELACYFITIMTKAFQNFCWGQSSFNETVLKEMQISVPILPNNQINYSFIINFVKVQEKLAIKDVVDYKNDIIKNTKKII